MIGRTFSGKRTKILYLDHVDNIGGGQRRLISLLSALKDTGEIDLIALVSERNEEFIDELLKLNIKIYPFQINLYHNDIIADVSMKSAISRGDFISHFWHVLKFITKVIKVEQPDIIYANTFKTGFYAACLRFIYRKKTVYAVLSARESSGHGIFDFFVMMSMDGMVFNSKYTKHSYNQLICEQRSKICINYSLIDNPWESHSTPSERMGLKNKLAPQGDKLIGYLGRINPRKRVEDFIKMGQIMLDQGMNVRFAIVGGYSPEQDPNYYPMIRKIAKDLLGKSVIFTGHVTNPTDYLSLFDVLVLPSLNEPLGRVVIEAVYLGVPVVATAPSGVTEVLENNKMSRLVPQKSPAALAMAVKDLLNKTKREYRQWPEKMDPEFLRKFSKESILNEELRLYKELLER